MFEFRPVAPGRFWLPPWASLPMHNSVSIAWKMGGGERYWIDWHQWFAGLSHDKKEAYKRRFPPPDRGGWEVFYELLDWRLGRGPR
jgi:hypothetical protein